MADDIITSARTDISQTPYDNVGFLQIKVFKNAQSQGDDFYKQMAKAIPTPGNVFSEKTVKDFLAALEKFSESVKSEFTTEKEAYSEKSKVLRTFYLPMPTDISESYSQSFEQSTFNMDNKMAAMGVDKLLTKVEARLPSVGGISRDVIDMVKVMGARGNATIDPNLINVYIGSVPRKLNFSIQFIPNNKKEITNILNIYRDLFNYSLGIKKNINISNLMNIGIIESPHIFTIDYYMVPRTDTAVKDLENGRDNSASVIKPLSYLLNTGTGSKGFYLSAVDITMGNNGDNLQLFDVDGELEQNDKTLLYDIKDAPGKSFKAPKLYTINLEFIEYKPLYRKEWTDIISKLNNTNTTSK